MSNIKIINLKRRLSDGKIINDTTNDNLSLAQASSLIPRIALTFSEIRHLGRSIVTEVSRHPGEAKFGIGAFLYKYLMPVEINMIAGVEEEYGNTRCNQWLCSVLNGTSDFKMIGRGFVVGV